VILQRYVLRELLLSFTFGLAILVSLLLLGGAFQAFRTTEGLALELVLRFVPLLTVELAPLAVLTASATAATLVYGRLAAENEIDAMRMSGISPARIFMPALLFGLLLSAATYGLAEHASPAAHFQRRSAFKETVLMALKAPPPGKYQLRVGNYRLGYDDCVEGRMQGLWLMKFNVNADPEIRYQSRSGYALIEEGQPPRLVMSHPEVVHYDLAGRMTTVTVGSDVTVDLEDQEGYRSERQPRDMASEELLAYAEALPRGARKRAEALTIFHTRYAQAAAPLLLVLVAMPTGVFVKKASRLAGLGAAVPPLLLYFVLFFVFQGMGAKGRVPALAAAYAPDALLLALGSGLLWRILRK
jgi:lipopolysaccharide export LptBFGC system permease protein LptF